MTPAVLDPRTPTARLDHGSVSQVETYDLCARKWWYEKCAAEDVVRAPPTKAQQFGTAGHGRIEAYLVTGIDVLTDRERAGKRFIPAPKTVAVEVKIEDASARPLDAAGVPFHGRIDVLNDTGRYVDDEGAEHDDPGTVEVVDWKFNRSLEWAKNPEQLRNSVQMVGYAEWVRRNAPDVRRVRVSHGVFQTEGACQARKTTAVLSPGEVVDRWARVAGLVEGMKVAARADRAGDVEGTLTACSAYGGCFYASVCPRAPGAALFSLFGPKTEGRQMGMMNFGKPAVADEVKKLEAEERTAIQKDPPPVEPPALVRAVGVLPPDAPKSEPPGSAVPVPAEALAGLPPVIAEAAKAWDVPAAAPAPAVKAKKRRTSAAAINIAGATVPSHEQVAEAIARAAGNTPITIYSDVYLEGLAASPLEPYIAALLKKIEDATGVPDVRFGGHASLDFGKWKGALAAAVAEEPPPPGAYAVIDVAHSEVKQVVVEALRRAGAAYARGM